MAKDIKIVYTPLHGTGLGPVKRVLSDLGFENVYIEPQQAVADGHFPTAPYPNPENPDAWELALKLAKEKDADLVLATDPDADRLGVYCKDTKSGEYVTFTGNMSAMLIAEYILGQKRANNSMPENPVLVESIVSTDMAKAIAKAYDVELVEVLTGFKYIGEQMLKYENPEKRIMCSDLKKVTDVFLALMQEIRMLRQLYVCCVRLLLFINHRERHSGMA